MGDADGTRTGCLKSKKKRHYGWTIVLTGMAVLFSCLGLGRFSLGMLLPSMGHSLEMNYSQMGLIGTGNFAGYMMSRCLGRRDGTKNRCPLGPSPLGLCWWAVPWCSLPARLDFGK